MNQTTEAAKNDSDSRLFDASFLAGRGELSKQQSFAMNQKNATRDLQSLRPNAFLDQCSVARDLQLQRPNDFLICLPCNAILAFYSYQFHKLSAFLNFCPNILFVVKQHYSSTKRISHNTAVY
jgi:hypothetical protein